MLKLCCATAGIQPRRGHTAYDPTQGSPKCLCLLEKTGIERYNEYVICATLRVGRADTEPTLDSLIDGEINVCKGIFGGTGVDPRDLMLGVPLVADGLPQAGTPRVYLVEPVQPVRELGSVWHDKLVR